LGTASGSCNITSVFYSESSTRSTAGLSGDFGSSSVQLQLTGVQIDAQAEFGLLKVKTASELDISGTPKFASALGYAFFRDVLTINSALQEGRNGQLLLSYDLTGSVFSLSADHGFAVLSSAACHASGASCNYSYSASFTGLTNSRYFMPPIPFTYGVPFVLQFDLSAYNGTVTLGPNNSVVLGLGTGVGIANVAFDNTFVLAGMTPADEFGNPVGDAAVRSDSGTQYNLAATVPEPGSILLLGSALLIMFLARLKRRMKDVERETVCSGKQI
jgi:hypothetical protein